MIPAGSHSPHCSCTGNTASTELNSFSVTPPDNISTMARTVTPAGPEGLNISLVEHCVGPALDEV